MEVRERIGVFVAKSWVVINIIALSLLLSILAGGIGTIFGFLIIIFTLWARKWDWSYFGIARNPLFTTITKALLFTVLIILVNDIFFSHLLNYILESLI